MRTRIYWPGQIKQLILLVKFKWSSGSCWQHQLAKPAKRTTKVKEINNIKEKKKNHTNRTCTVHVDSIYGAFGKIYYGLKIMFLSFAESSRVVYGLALLWGRSQTIHLRCLDHIRISTSPMYQYGFFGGTLVPTHSHAKCAQAIFVFQFYWVSNVTSVMLLLLS